MILRDENGGTPLYQQIASQIIDYIQEHNIAPGQRLPSEKELCSLYSASRVTVRAAVDLLVKSNTVVRQQGKGTYVASSTTMHRHLNEGMSSFTKICRQNGAEPSSKVINMEITELPKRAASFLGIPEGTKGICIRRIRFADGNPASFETNYFRMEHLSLLQENLDGSLHELLASKEYTPCGCHTELEVCTATKLEAEELQVFVGKPLLLLSNYYHYIENGILKPLYLGKDLIVTDRLKYSFERL